MQTSNEQTTTYNASFRGNRPTAFAMVKGFEIFSQSCGLPDSVRLLSLVSELNRRGQTWDYFRATDAATGNKIETIVVDDIAWQFADGEIETGGFDSARRILWLSGGRPVDLTGTTLEMSFASRPVGKNQRRHLRVPLAVEVAIGDGTTTGTTYDLSHGGAFVKTRAFLHTSDRLIMAFNTASGPIFLAAEVVRVVADKGVAVRFVHQDDAQREEIRRAVNELLRTPKSAELSH